MTLQDNLDELRNGTVGCDLTAFGDLSSGLILRASTSERLPRERLDALCDAAKRNFALHKSLSANTSAENSETSQFTISFSDESTSIFVRGGHTLNDLTCAVFGAGHCTQSALDAVLSSAQDITEDDE